MARIVLEHVDVHYPVLQDQYRSMRRYVLRRLSGGRVYTQDTALKLVHAIKDLTITIEDGDRVGLIGRNGAGKSTLLKTLGGFILPDRGNLQIEGRITPIFSVAGGMDPERTGYDNIFLTGRMLAIPKKDMEQYVEGIREFSELGNFLSMPVRTYSDGMKIRLGFAIATCVTPEILLMDEAIGAGDAHFIAKAQKRAQELYDRASIMVLASHTPEIISTLCNKVIWMDHGRLVKMGTVEEVLPLYTSGADANALVGDA